MQAPDTRYHNLIHQARMVIPRLEKLTPDSSFAHQASGCRRNLLRIVDQFDRSPAGTDWSLEAPKLEHALEFSYQILEKAAKEMPADDEGMI
ncbi:MAG: hypothetical protein GWO10_02400 [candidate division Zixibacteria bacterium]|nr:hypothetical protein [candidate division Zixibacteria bacterium]NIX17179.1 hypothetical protein [Gammaproteobacteria bacterium]